MRQRIVTILGIRFFCLFFIISGLDPSAYALPPDRLTVVSAHRKSVQQEFIPLFETYYKAHFQKEVVVDWVDHSGASNSLRFILAKFDANPRSCDMDVLWGGGEHPFMELARRELLLPTPLSKELRAQIPDTLMGVPMHGKGQEWHAAALSAFGIFYNKKMLQLLSLPPPQTWEELSHAKFFDTLSNGDPRKSSSALTMNLVVLEAIGWEKGWPLLTAIATNTRKFSMNSSDPSKAIISGEAAAGMVIDYFAYSKIAELGEDKLGFVLPASKTIINPDPIALLKGAPHEVPGARFIEFVLSPQGQRLLILPKGAPTGPKQSVLGRMSANRQAYDVPSGQVLAAVNPFVVNVPTAKVDMERMTKLQFVFSDLMGVVHIDAHKELKEAWRTATKRGVPQDKILAFLGEPLVTRDELLKLSLEWDKPLTRNTTMSKWEQKIRERYAQVVSGKALPKS